MTVSRWSARAAANNRASASGPRRLAAPDNRTWRMISAPGEPPGSRVSRTPMPVPDSLLARSLACVDLPVPSPPSNVMNFPAIFALLCRRPDEGPERGHSTRRLLERGTPAHRLYLLRPGPKQADDQLGSGIEGTL